MAEPKGKKYSWILYFYNDARWESQILFPSEFELIEVKMVFSNEGRCHLEIEIQYSPYDEPYLHRLKVIDGTDFSKYKEHWEKLWDIEGKSLIRETTS